jgi:transposase-like zinc ribbon protein
MCQFFEARGYGRLRADETLLSSILAHKPVDQGGGRMAGLLDFAARFGTEERCIEHLAGLRWPGGFVCSGCGGRVARADCAGTRSSAG